MSKAPLLPPVTPLQQLLAALRTFFSQPDLCEISATERDELEVHAQRLNTLITSQRTPVTIIPVNDQTSHIYFDYALTGILETDGQWAIIRANPAAFSITGYDIKALHGRSLPTLTKAISQHQVERHFSLLLEQGINQSEWHLTRRDGEDITIEIASIQVNDDHFIHVFDDVTEQRRASAEIERARQAAEIASRIKSEFLANISHEIRTPLNGIIGLSHLALMGNLGMQQRDYVEKIGQSGRTLLKIINELLDFAKIEAQRMEFEHIEFSLNELLDELGSISAQVPAKKTLEIVFQVPPDLPRLWVGDRLRIGQCLNNLLGNAIKFTTSGSVILEITVTGEKNGQTLLHFCVADSGIGIAPEVLTHLFEPFVQADASTNRRFGGTGLGLTITRALAHGMGGDLYIESEPGAGSRFTLAVPLLAADGTAPPPPAAGNALVIVARTATRSSSIKLLISLGWHVTALTFEEGDINASDLTNTNLAGTPDLILIDAADGWSPWQKYCVRQKRQPLPPLLVINEPGDVQPHLPEIDKTARIVAATRPLTPASLKRALRRLGLVHDTADNEVTQNNIPSEFRGAHILVAEDNPVNQSVIIELLRLAGIQTTLAQNGHELIDYLDTATILPDIILMDVQMPGMDGLNATRLLRERGYTLPVIGLSAGASREEEARCMEAGMNDFVVKPIDTDELWGSLTRWIRPRNSIVTSPEAESVEVRFLNNPGILHKARQAFIENHAADAVRLHELIAIGDFPAMAHITHGLKGAAATIGTEQITHLAHALDTKVNNALTTGVASDDTSTLIHQLESALKQFNSHHISANR